MSATQQLHEIRAGIPRIEELDRLQGSELYRAPSEFNARFLKRHEAALQNYGRHWGSDPFGLWSRRWEYPFAASRLLEFLSEQEPSQPMTVMDAGSGVTFFPYYICARRPNTHFVCVDYDPTYASMFDSINRNESADVRFVQASLQKLPLKDGELDAIVCISVLEHTENYPQIIDEFLRVLRPGGLFVLTFDLSLDGKFTLPLPQAQALLRMIQKKFVLEDGIDVLAELSRMHDSGNLTSDHVRRTKPQLLPWNKSVRVYKAVQDLLKGKGWTGGFRSRTVFCCDARKP